MSLTATAQASRFGAGHPLFHCTFSDGRKTVDLCLQDDIVLYHFGATDRTPDILLARQVTGVSMAPWNGVARVIWDDVTPYNYIYSYILSFAIERNVDDKKSDGSLIVAEKDIKIVELVFDANSVIEADFYPLFDTKEMSGQKYCSETNQWGEGS